MPPLSGIVLVLLFLLGASIGSFVNVVIYRLPRNESLLFPRSHCLSCGARLTFVDLVPVLSCLLLRGRCRHCGKRFSVRYLLVEAACGLLAVACVEYFQWTAYALVMFVAGCALLAIFFIDLDHMIIPDELTALVAAVGLACDGYALARFGSKQAIVFSEQIGSQYYSVYLPRSLVGMVLAGGIFLFIAWAAQAVFKKPAMGMGDVKLAGAMGAILGPGYLFVSYFLLCILIGAGVSVLLIVLRLRGRRDYIPFGPMMAAAGLIMLLWAHRVAPWLLACYTR